MTRSLRRFHRHLLATACVLGALAPWSAAQAQSTACINAKDYVLREVAKPEHAPLADRDRLEEEIYRNTQQFGCETGVANMAFFNSARQCGASVNFIGNLGWEEMSCCGYDPQRRTFACPVKINRNTGFGAAPLPGSREFVMHCVFDTQQNAWRVVGTDSVHLADSPFQPPWQFAVVANAHRNLDLVQPMDGTTQRARSILSWNLRPTGCDYKPVFGNVIDHRIRLDQ